MRIFGGIDQPDVDGRPRRRHRPGHRRCGGGGGEHPPPRRAKARRASIDAVPQLMAPLVSSTLTTVVVFAPLGLLSGVAGQFFRALSHEPVGGGAAVAGAVGHGRAAAGAVGVPPPSPRRGEPRRTRSIALYGAALDAMVRRPARWPSSVAVAAGRRDRRRCSTRSAPASCRRPTRAASSSTT